MATVRITGNISNASREDWLGAPAVDANGHVARSIPLPEDAFLAIERGIHCGSIEGVVQLPSGAHLNWLVDRPWREAPAAPVARKTPEKSFRNIVVPVDLGDRHGRAVELSAQVVAEGGEVTLLHVIEQIEGLPHAEAVDFYGQLEAKAEVRLGHLLGQLRRRGIAGRVVVVHGKCVQEVVAFAARTGADLIVVSSHPVVAGAGWGTRSYQIAVVAPCPVLLVK